eukprot:365775-Chlamydomonas_euryale.AAC.5
MVENAGVECNNPRVGSAAATQSCIAERGVDMLVSGQRQGDSTAQQVYGCLVSEQTWSEMWLLASRPSSLKYAFWRWGCLV